MDRVSPAGSEHVAVTPPHHLSPTGSLSALERVVLPEYGDGLLIDADYAGQAGALGRSLDARAGDDTSGPPIMICLLSRSMLDTPSVSSSPRRAPVDAAGARRRTAHADERATRKAQSCAAVHRARLAQRRLRPLGPLDRIGW